MGKHHVIQHFETKKCRVVTTKQILKLVNEDRSESWIDYDETDFIEGLNEFTDWHYIGEME